MGLFLAPEINRKQVGTMGGLRLILFSEKKGKGFCDLLTALGKAVTRGVILWCVCVCVCVCVCSVGGVVREDMSK